MPILTPEERIGSLLAGKYQLEKILGEGGMGVVFEATHTWTGRKCAVKMMHTAHARERDVARRFLQEARTAAAVRHPNVVDVLDMGSEEDGSVYLVLELLSGETLSALLKRNRLDPQQALDILLPAMGAIATAHDRGIIHRDLKPENIFLHHDQGEVFPKVLDFGLAKALLAETIARTSTGLVMGTPYYIAPEQAAGEPNTGTAVDVWAMGVVLYETLAGRVPFPGDSPTAVILKVCTSEPAPLHEVAPHVPAPLANAVHGALIKATEERYSNLRELGNAVIEAARACGIAVRVPRGLGDAKDRLASLSSQSIPIDDGKNPSLATTPLPAYDAVAESSTSVDKTSTEIPAIDEVASRTTGPVPAHPAAISSPNLPTRPPLLLIAGAAFALLVLAGVGIGIGLVVASGDPPPVSATHLREPQPAPAAAEPELAPPEPPPSIPVAVEEEPVREEPVRDMPVQEAPAQPPVAAQTEEPERDVRVRRPRPRSQPQVQTLDPGPQRPRRPNISTQW